MHHRIAVFGDGGVGKSALTQVFVNRTFPSDYDPTIEDAYHAAVDFNGEKIFLDILDTAGQDEYSSMREQYMTSANGFILAFAINSRSSFEHLSAIRAQLLKRNPRAACVLVGTKSDLHLQRAVSREEAQALAALWKIEYIEVSAMLAVNTSACFFTLVAARRAAPPLRLRSLSKRRSWKAYAPQFVHRLLGLA